MENREFLRVTGDLEGKTSLRCGCAGEPGGVAVSESCLQHIIITFTPIIKVHQTEMLQNYGKEKN